MPCKVTVERRTYVHSIHFSGSNGLAPSQWNLLAETRKGSHKPHE
jgi:hypothetical protein